MAKDKITEYDATANNNTVCGDVNIAENSALPSDMNNFAREIMSHLKEGLGSGTPLYVDQTNNRLGIGTSSPVAKLDVTGAIDADDKITIAYEAGSSNWELESTSGDDFSVSRNGSETFLLDGSTSYAHFRGGSQVRITMGSAGTAGTNTANWIRASGNQIDLNTAGDGYGFEVTGTQRVVFANNGNVTNSTGSYGTISDEKLKENISDASSQWDDIKALQVRKYSMKEDNLDSANKIGVIAQELETSDMNGLVEEIKWNKETVKTVKYSILYMKAIKALQEAMTRIETLEAKVTALENAE